MVLVQSVQIINSTTYVTTSYDTLIIDATDPTVNVILPAISQDGQLFKIKRVDTTDNLVFILGSNSDTVGYNSSQFLSNDQVIDYISINSVTNWEVFLNQTP